MLHKIKKLEKHILVTRLKDVRVLGLLVFLVIVVLVSWSGASVIQTNFDLEKQVSTLDQQNQVAELQNNNLKLQNEFYNTDTYLELQARKQFGKAVAGETEVIVPKNVAMSYVVELPDLDAKQGPTSVPQQSRYQHNFESWMNFFLHRQITSFYLQSNTAHTSRHVVVDVRLG